MIKKQNSPENKFECFKSLKFCNINFEMQFWYNNKL